MTGPLPGPEQHPEAHQPQPENPYATPYFYPPANPYAASMAPRPHGLRAHPKLWKGGAAATALAAVAAVSFAAGTREAGTQV
jgi:hypothetical protein